MATKADIDRLFEEAEYLTEIAGMTPDQLFEKLDNELSKVSELFDDIQEIVLPVERTLMGGGPVKESMEDDRIAAGYSVAEKLKELNGHLKHAMTILYALEKMKKNNIPADLEETQFRLDDLRDRMKLISNFTTRLPWFTKPLLQAGYNPNKLTNDKAFQIAYYKLILIAEKLKTITNGFPGLNGIKFPQIENKMPADLMNHMKSVVVIEPPMVMA